MEYMDSSREGSFSVTDYFEHASVFEIPVNELPFCMYPRKSDPPWDLGKYESLISYLTLGSSDLASIEFEAIDSGISESVIDGIRNF
jgi:hypothetical protein